MLTTSELVTALGLVISSSVVSALVNVAWSWNVKRDERRREAAREAQKTGHVYLGIVILLERFARKCDTQLHAIAEGLDAYRRHDQDALNAIKPVNFEFPPEPDWTALPIPFVAKLNTLPPRYVILGCHINAGAGAPPTQLMRVKDAGFPLPESRYETFVVKNGRSSFYSTIASTDRPWIRFDPGCMSARTAQGHTMLEALESLPAQPCLSLEWAVGEILVFDNWAVLHRRGSASGSGHRALLRISLND